jgi:ABC-2 type transport system permease protein
VLIGAGMGRSFRGTGIEDGNYLRFFFPGTVLMILLFTAIFSTISIIEDRREGFLQSVLVAPVSRMSIVLGKVLGGTVLAFAQGTLFLLVAPLVGIRPPAAGFALALLMMLVISFGLTGLGFCIAWRMNSTQGFHAIMNLFLMPLWFLSGALFPAEGAMGGIKWIMRANPLSYGLDGLRDAIYWTGDVSGFAASLLVSTVAAGVVFALATAVASGRSSGDVE